MEIKRGGASPAGNLRQEKRSCCSRCHPPSRLLGVGPAPFPGDCGKGGGRGLRAVGGARGTRAPARAQELILLLGPVGWVLCWSLALLQLWDRLSCLGRRVSAFREAEVRRLS